MMTTKRFCADRRGNFAIFASLLVVPLVLSAGVALDLSTISRTRTELQQAMDAAVLAVAREGKDVSDAQAADIARLFVANNYHLQFTDLKVNRDGTAVTVDAVTKAGIAFGGLFGYSDWPVVASSTADIAYASYEIALVLDTTGSMAGGKLTAMKDAVDGMIESMSAQVQDKNKLRFALVPFASFVNVGPEHGPSFDKNGIQIAGTGASWLDLYGESPIPQSELSPGASRFQAYKNVGKSWPGCVETRPEGGSSRYDVTNAAANRNTPESLFVPAFAIDEPDEAGYRNSYITSDVRYDDKTADGKKRKHAKYALPTDASGNPKPIKALADIVGALGLGGDDDDEDEDEGGRASADGIVAIDDSGSGYQGYDKGPDFGCQTRPIAPLTNDYNTMRARVKELNAQGNTNIMEGVAWGNRVLTHGGPLPGAQDAKKTPGIDKIMIVLTDGANTLGNSNTGLGSYYSSFGYLTDGRLGIEGGGSAASNTAMNARTLAACENAKANGVTVYTIRLEEPDVKTGTMLQECATSEEYYFDAPSRSQLDEVFQTIRDRVVRVRISS